MRERYWRSLIACGVRRGWVRFPLYAQAFKERLLEEFPDGRIAQAPPELRDDEEPGLSTAQELEQAMREGSFT